MVYNGIASADEVTRFSMYIKMEIGSRDYFRSSWTINDSHPILSINRRETYICNFCTDLDFTSELQFSEKHRHHLSKVLNITGGTFARVSYSCIFSDIVYCTVFHFTSMGTFSYTPISGAELNNFDVSSYVKGPDYEMFAANFKDLKKRWNLVLKRMTELNQPKYVTAKLCVSKTERRIAQCIVHSPSKVVLSTVLVTGGFPSAVMRSGKPISSGVISDVSGNYSLPMYCLIFSSSNWIATFYYHENEDCVNRSLSSVDLEVYPVPYYTMLEKTRIIRQRYHVPTYHKEPYFDNSAYAEDLTNDIFSYIMGLTAFCVLATPVLVGIISLRKWQYNYSNKYIKK